LLKGTAFHLVQGKGFDAGNPQPTKAEQALNQIQTGKIANPMRQPEVKDIIARIKKGEFSGADYVLFGTLSNIEFRDQFSPLQGTTSATLQYGLDLLADFTLINTKTFRLTPRPSKSRPPFRRKERAMTSRYCRTEVM
jgi:hypothetical protein